MSGQTLEIGEYFTEDALDRIIEAPGERFSLDEEAGGRTELHERLEYAADRLFSGFPSRRSLRVAVDEFVETLQEIWTSVFIEERIVRGKKIAFRAELRTSVHRTTYEATGPLVRFLYACCCKLRNHLEAVNEANRDLADTVDEFTHKGLKIRAQREVADALGQLTPEVLRMRVRRGKVRERMKQVIRRLPRWFRRTRSQ